MAEERVNKIVDTMLEHPFYTVMIIGATGKAVASIITALKGCSTPTTIKIVETKTVRDN